MQPLEPKACRLGKLSNHVATLVVWIRNHLGDGEKSVWLERGVQRAHRGGAIRNLTKNRYEEGTVESFPLEPRCFERHAKESNIGDAPRRRPVSHAVDHRLLHIDRDNFTSASNALGGRDGDPTRPASGVEYAHTRIYASAVEDCRFTSDGAHIRTLDEPTEPVRARETSATRGRPPGERGDSQARKYAGNDNGQRRMLR